MGPARGADPCPPRSRFAPGAVLLQQKIKTCPRTRRSTRPGCEWGPARGADLCSLRARFAPGAVLLQQKPKPPANPLEHPPRVRMVPAQDANPCPPRSRFAPRRCSYNKTKAACEPVGAPAPGANGCLPAPYPVIGKPGPLHKLGVPDISTIQQQRLVHLRMQTLEVRAPVGLPFGYQHQRISAGGSFVGIIMQDQIIPLP